MGNIDAVLNRAKEKRPDLYKYIIGVKICPEARWLDIDNSNITIKQAKAYHLKKEILLINLRVEEATCLIAIPKMRKA